MVKNRNTGMQVAHLAVAKRELFNPKKKTNIDSNYRMIDIVSMGIPQMKKELIDMRRTTWRNLSKSVDHCSWEHSTKEDTIMTRGCHTTNDQSESTLGGTTWDIELGGMIKIPQAAAQSDGSRNGFWNRPITTKR